MQFFKKTIVLKEITESFSTLNKRVGGIARLESENGVSVFHLSLINILKKEQGCYFAYLLSSPKDLTVFKLGARPTNFNKTLEDERDFSSGFAVGIVYIDSGIPTLVAFGAEQGKSISVAEFKKLVLEKCLAETRTKKDILFTAGAPEQKPPVPLPFPKKLPVAPDQNPYDDEVVATENFYLNDEKFLEKIRALESIGDYDRTETSDQPLYGKETPNKMRKGTDRAENETNFCHRETTKIPYYQSVKKGLDKLFSQYPEEPTLKLSMPNSSWIKIPLENGKHYAVGLIKENGKEKYICYGAPAPYSATPPKELGANAVFVPLSIFNLHGNGYWLLFQDAITGESVLPS